MKKTNIKKVNKVQEDRSETIIRIAAIRINLAKDSKNGHLYLYDTGATHHTTNEYHRLEDIEDVDIEVEAHDGSKSWCKKRGTLVFWHDGKESRLRDTLFDPRYSNIISGQRIEGKHKLVVDGEQAQLRCGRKIIFKMTKDARGFWIAPEQEKEPRDQGSTIGELERYGHISFDIYLI